MFLLTCSMTSALRLFSCLALGLSFGLPIACGGNSEESGGSPGNGDAETGGSSTGDGDASTGGSGTASGGSSTGGSSPSDGDGDTSTGGNHAGDGDGDAAGGSSGGQNGNGDGGSGGASPTGICFDEPCTGACAPAEGAELSCSSDWQCLSVLVCTRDIVSYCGCDGDTFEASSSCPPFAYAYEGACDTIAGGLNCDGSQVLTDGPTPTCEDFDQVPQVINGTWGDCVDLRECGCDPSSGQDQCGGGQSYICYNDGRCGHLLD